MRQVPRYVIIGNGRVAKHMCYYFSCLGIQYLHWYRQLPQQKLIDTLSHSSHILILISDSHIEAFIKAHQQLLKNKVVIHFSGSHISQQAYSAHPIMTFGPKLYDIDIYQNMTFVVEDSGPEFCDLLPGLANQSYKIKSEDKAYYHALCVMANNFSSILWQKCFATMKDKFQIPKQAIMPLLTQTFSNLCEGDQNTLTGPLIRKDFATIEKNLSALEHDEFYLIYQSFVKTVMGDCYEC